ncbi:MAG: NADH-quinone oxidoreductase subunit N, partial [Candidatus Sumerlaeota bacterium]|nr:NADH-quinone oxidoreductase subunit N [Candidatus Sumerlaeota bacterium]
SQVAAGGETAPVFRGLLVLDGMARFFRLFFLSAGLTAVVFSLRSRALTSLRMGEFHVSLLTATMGMSLLAASSDWMMFYIALETVSLPSYVLAGYLRSERRSVEASLKYALYGGVASAVMLFGISYLYGLSGTLDIAGSFAHSGAAPQMHALALMLVMAGLLFKIASVPFQFWAPDVYEGAPTPVTAWLSVASKAAGFAALLRVFSPFLAAKSGAISFLGPATLMWLFWGLSAATMTFGNLAAIKQTNLKRLLAYSSIAHAGYLLMALTVMNQPDMLRTMLFYLAIYFVMNFGAFYCVMLIENRTGRADIAVFRGILAVDSPSRASAELAVTMVLCLLSLTGLPVLAGFIAKFLLFGLLIQNGSVAHVSLALIAVANSVISLYYYFRIVRAMTLDMPETDLVGQYRLPLFDRAALWAFSAALLWFFFSWQTLLKAADAGKLFLAGL